ncbi:hypothetical protein [Ferrimonas balearica]|uniref:hypothetical protein n=1 Tax=Ferrimonas balearica TaxID=44012 RepID=UPI001C996983|nr:hypothetical protein [Ferrimonas balearica]MBY5990987.1 hypothetical protein [Ferrimonas balearica]
MFNNMNLLSTLALPLFLSLSCYSEAATVHYLPLPSGGEYRPTISIKDNGSVYYGSDVGYQLLDCSSREYLCFRHNDFVFSFPNDDVTINQEWQIDDIRFKVLSKEPLLVLGVSEEVYVISDDEGNHFYYSIDGGLLGFRFQSVIYFSEGEFGYAF